VASLAQYQLGMPLASSIWRRCLAVSLSLATLIGPGSALLAAAEHPIDFASEIRPLFNKNCVMCHGGVKRAGDISFIVRERALEPGKSGEIPIVPGNAEKSEVIYRVGTTNEEDRMPPPKHGPALPKEDIERLRKWIKEGAPWTEHWAYVPPKPQPLPKVSRPGWCREPLDRFILARLDAEKLKPAKDADRLQWLRRVTFDLTGLPPTLEETAAFTKGWWRDSYEDVVDRLLASPAFGERWAVLWMDLARYAETQGYEKDSGRNVWPYRDWLIRACNDDLPYDQFALKQLAGDLLPDGTIDDEVATTMQRLTPTNAEGGTDDEEYRIAAVLDRVNTLWTSFQGVTFRCTQCHAHPYDPIDHEDFYRFVSFYNTSRDWDQPGDAPLLSVPLNRDDNTKARSLDARAAALIAEERKQVTQVETRTETDWAPLRPSAAESTGQATLEIKPEGKVTELITSGTISDNTRFTVTIPLPDEIRRVTALRVDALPKNLEAALLTPETGFVLTQFKAKLLPVGTEIEFAHVFGDDDRPFSDPEQSIDKGRGGWGPFPRIDRPRHAVFVLKHPLAIPAGSSLQLSLSFNAASGDQTPQVMTRGRFSVTQSDEWTRLIESAPFTQRRQELAETRSLRSKIPAVAIPVMSEQPANLRRETAVFVRGNWMQKGDVVSPAVPKIFNPLPPADVTNRLTMAQWLVSKDNPLTARVAVNRLWEELFGTGIVETLEDFGSSGTMPSHPELLDYLALRFQNDLGWSRKKLLRELVLSTTYRQDAAMRPELADRDPRNRLLARGPRNRLSAEMVRDQALAISGLLSSKMYGAPVMPLQPEGIWRSVYSNAKWETSAGEDRHRRAVYTYWKRTAAYPSFVTFDAPSRDVCTARRIPTSTPLQALVTMNDPVYFEAAQALAARMAVVDSTKPADQISAGWELATGGPADRRQIKALLGLYERSLAKFQADAEKSGQVAARPEFAALTVVANALLNVDAVLTK
jgi:hypothetical protein